MPPPLSFSPGHSITLHVFIIASCCARSQCDRLRTCNYASSIQDTILKRTKSLQTLGSRLQLICGHNAFCLLRMPWPSPKYILRTSPCFLIPALHDFNSLLRSLQGTILNVSLSESAWTQASLPVYTGGLGVQSTTQLAPSANLLRLRVVHILIVQ